MERASGGFAPSDSSPHQCRAHQTQPDGTPENTKCPSAETSGGGSVGGGGGGGRRRVGREGLERGEREGERRRERECGWWCVVKWVMCVRVGGEVV